MQNCNTLELLFWSTAAISSLVPYDKEALRLIEEANSFDLVFLCHSVPESSRVSLVTRIKELKPGLPILVLYNGYDPTNAKVDGSLHSLDTPESMLEMVAFLTKNIAV